MRHFPRRLAGVTLVAAAALLAPLAPHAVADPVPADAGPSMLVMAVTTGTSTTAGASRSAVLDCGAQPGGTHPAPAAACAALRADGLDFTSRPAQQVMCPDIVRPVTVTATGVWNGAPVEYQRTYDNECLMRRATGVLFAL